MKEEFKEIIESKDLKNITADILEKALDNEITSETLKEIPILKSIIAVRNIYSSYTDRIFIKKAMTVLLEIGEINWKQRVELNRDLDDEHENGAEKILMAIDRLETSRKCVVFGRLCKLKALGKINKEDFLRLTKLIQDAYLEDLEYINDFEPRTGNEISLEEYISIMALGLIYQENSEKIRNH